jgi:hypothetical protein
MEQLIYQLILGLDRLTQKPLRQVFSDLDHLLTDPADFFHYQEVTIGPWRRWGSGASVSFLFWLGLTALTGVLLNLAGPNLGGGGEPLRVAIMAILLPPVCLWLGMSCVRGGSCVLNVAGVRFVRGSVHVFCPWSLFAAPGQPIIHPIHGRNRSELPVMAAAVPLVQARRHELILAEGIAVKTGQLRFRSPQEVLLKNLYRVKPDELAWLLLQLGRSLGGSASALQKLPAEGSEQYSASTYPPADEGAVGPHAEASAAVSDTDGWITVSLTQLAFPNRCCECGAPTASKQAFKGYSPLLRLGRFLNLEGAEHVWVHVPICKDCQTSTRIQRRRTFWRTFLRVLGIGIGLGFLVGTLLALVGGDPRLSPALPIGFSLIAGLISLLIAWFRAKWAAGKGGTPVQVQRYLPQKGTVSLRFRRPEYAEQLLQAMETETARRGVTR